MGTAKEIVISRGFTSLFLIHCIISILFGLLFCFVPEAFADMFNSLGNIDMYPTRLVGVFFLVIGATDWLCFVSKRVQEVKIIVIMEIVLSILAAIVCWCVCFLTWCPCLIWFASFLFPLFSVAWIYFYVKYL